MKAELVRRVTIKPNLYFSEYLTNSCTECPGSMMQFTNNLYMLLLYPMIKQKWCLSQYTPSSILLLQGRTCTSNQVPHKDRMIKLGWWVNSRRTHPLSVWPSTTVWTGLTSEPLTFLSWQETHYPLPRYGQSLVTKDDSGRWGRRQSPPEVLLG